MSNLGSFAKIHYKNATKHEYLKLDAKIKIIHFEM